MFKFEGYWNVNFLRIFCTTCKIANETKSFVFDVRERAEKYLQASLGI